MHERQHISVVSRALCLCLASSTLPPPRTSLATPSFHAQRTAAKSFRVVCAGYGCICSRMGHPTDAPVELRLRHINDCGEDVLRHVQRGHAWKLVGRRFDLGTQRRGKTRESAGQAACCWSLGGEPIDRGRVEAVSAANWPLQSCIVTTQAPRTVSGVYVR